MVDTEMSEIILEFSNESKPSGDKCRTKAIHKQTIRNIMKQYGINSVIGQEKTEARQIAESDVKNAISTYIYHSERLG